MVEYAPYWVVSATGREPAHDLGEARSALVLSLSEFGHRLTMRARDEADAEVFRRLVDRSAAAYGLSLAAAYAEPGACFFAADEGGFATRFALEEGEAPPEAPPTTLWVATGLDAEGRPLSLLFGGPDDHEDAVQSAFDHEVFGPPEYYYGPSSARSGFDPPSITLTRLADHLLSGSGVVNDSGRNAQPSDGVALRAEA